MLLLTQLTYTGLQRGSSGCQKWKTPSELHPSISDSSCSSKIRSTISTKSVSQIAKLFTHPYVSPSTNEISFLARPITSPTHENVIYPRQVTMYSTSPLVNQFSTYCALTSCCMHPFPKDTTLPLSTTATNHHFSISCIHIQTFVKKASSPFRHTSTKLLHCWCHKYQVISIQLLTLDVDKPSLSPAYVLTTVQACVYMTHNCADELLIHTQLTQTQLTTSLSTLSNAFSKSTKT